MSRQTELDYYFGLMIIFLLMMIVFSFLPSCGQTLHVDGRVDGVVSGGTQSTGAITIVPSASAFLPFFETQCATMVSGQLCYSADILVCATCLADSLESSLTPSPSPTPTH